MANINGLGIINISPEGSPLKRAVIHTPIAAASILGTIVSVGMVSKASTLGKVGLLGGASILAVTAVDSIICLVESVASMIAPTPEPVIITEIRGLGSNPYKRQGLNPTKQPGEMVAQDHWLDRRWLDRYENWWDVPNRVKNWI